MDCVLKKNDYQQQVAAADTIDAVIPLVSKQLKLLLYVVERMVFDEDEINIKNGIRRRTIKHPVSYYKKSHPQTKSQRVILHPEDDNKIMIMEYLVRHLWDLQRARQDAIKKEILALSLKTVIDSLKSFSGRVAENENLSEPQLENVCTMKKVVMDNHHVLMCFLEILPSRNKIGEQNYCKAIYRELGRIYFPLTGDTKSDNTAPEEFTDVKLHNALQLYNKVRLED